MNYGIKGFHPLEIIHRRWDIDRKSRTSASGRRDCPSDLKGGRSAAKIQWRFGVGGGSQQGPLARSRTDGIKAELKSAYIRGLEAITRILYDLDPDGMGRSIDALLNEYSDAVGELMPRVVPSLVR